MKTKVITTILGMFFCAALLCATDVSAASEWYTCTIDMVGPGWNRIYVKVSDTASSPAFTKKWCVLDENWLNQMLAVCLTAITNDQTITIKIDPAVKNPEITEIFLNQN